MFQRFTLALLVAHFCTAALAQNIHYEQNFDGLKDGDMDGQDEWAIGAPAGGEGSPVITGGEKHGPAGKSVEVSNNQEVVRNFDPKISSGVHFLSIWFRFENPGVGNNTLHVYMGDVVREWQAGPVLRIGAQSGDPFQVGAHNGNDVTPIAPITKGEWQHIFQVMDVDNATYSVWVDDVLAASDFAWRNPANHKALGWLMLGFDGGDGLIGYYDDVVFGEGDQLPRAVSPGSKLATAWAAMKR